MDSVSDTKLHANSLCIFLRSATTVERPRYEHTA